MTTTNPFDLLDHDSEDIHQLVAAKPLKVEKPVPVQAAQAVVREAKNGHGGRRDGGGGRRDGGGDRRDGGGYNRDGGVERRDGGGYNRGRGGEYNRDSRNGDAPANGNGVYRRSEEGDGARRGGYAGGYRRGGDSGNSRRNFDRHSGTGHGNDFKRDGAGRRNKETTEDEIPPVNGEATSVVDKDLLVGGEGEATDAKEEKPLKVRDEREPEPEVMSLEEYEKILEEKKKALQATKVEERKVDTTVFDSMQQLSSKKSNNDDVFIKLGTEKDKHIVEKEEKTRKSVSINEFLKTANGERYRGGYRGGRGGRGPREGADQRNGGGFQRDGDQRNGGGNQRNGGGNQRNGDAAAPKTAAPKIVKPQIPAPKIEDTAQFPTLGK